MFYYDSSESENKFFQKKNCRYFASYATPSASLYNKYCTKNKKKYLLLLLSNNDISLLFFTFMYSEYVAVATSNIRFHAPITIMILVFIVLELVYGLLIYQRYFYIVIEKSKIFFYRQIVSLFSFIYDLDESD